jgi:putative transposase
LADSLADPPTAQPSRVAVDELAVRINGELYWFDAAIDTETKFLLGAELLKYRGNDAATEFLRSLRRKYDLSEAVFLVDGYGYLTALVRLDLRSARLLGAKPHRKMVLHSQNADRPLSRLLGGQSGQRSAVARCLCCVL